MFADIIGQRLRGGLFAGEHRDGSWEHTMTVVLAEDDVDIRDLVQIVLEGLDLKVKAVGTGADALAACQEEPPRLLLLDITMPGMNGLEVCRAVRSDERLKDLPVILMTARAQASDVAAGMEAGADTYIIKPFGPIELREHVEALLDRDRSN
jgi:two-component system response regulator MtrA